MPAPRPGKCTPSPSNKAVAAETLAIVKAGRYRVAAALDPAVGDPGAARASVVDLNKSRLKAASANTTMLNCLSSLRLPPLLPGSGYKTDVVLFNGDSFAAAAWMLRGAAESNGCLPPPLVLDFASDSNPGGGFRGNQQGTQEESLCRRSNLGACLEAVFAQTGSAGYMPDDGAVYAPDVVVFRGSVVVRKYLH